MASLESYHSGSCSSGRRYKLQLHIFDDGLVRWIRHDEDTAMVGNRSTNSDMYEQQGKQSRLLPGAAAESFADDGERTCRVKCKVTSRLAGWQ
jgi:hypothetical protein